MTVRAVLRRTVGAQWPILAGVNFWRRGALLIGIGVGVAAVLRLVLSEERAGLLVSWTLRALSAAGNGDAVVQPSGAGIHEVDVKIT